VAPRRDEAADQERLGSEIIDEKRDFSLITTAI
jgi:hypothetical protein